jgi:acetoin utilization deacetylase AcuC-like enzyme
MPKDINWIDEYKKTNLARDSTKKFIEDINEHARGTEERIAATLQGFYDDQQHRNGSSVKKFLQANKTFLHSIIMAQSKKLYFFCPKN